MWFVFSLSSSLPSRSVLAKAGGGERREEEVVHLNATHS
jgi:hypothetical protein